MKVTTKLLILIVLLNTVNFGYTTFQVNRLEHQQAMILHEINNVFNSNLRYFDIVDDTIKKIINQLNQDKK